MLGGTIAPLDGIGPEALRIDALARRIERGGIDEVILATNPNPRRGDRALRRRARGESAYDHGIGYGMPIGGDLEYVDPITVRKSLENRRSFKS